MISKIISHRRLIFLFLAILPVFAAGQQGGEERMDSSIAIKESPVLKKSHKGIASYYHDKFEGRKMSNGQIYNKMKMTAASNKIALNKWVRVLNPLNGNAVIVKITDRMHPKNKRLIDLSFIAARELGMLSSGIVNVIIEEIADISTFDTGSNK